MPRLGHFPSEDIRYRKIDGCCVILDFCTQTYCVLDESATELWEVLAGEVDAEPMIERWLAEYDLCRDEVLATLAEFSDECRSKGWLKPWVAKQTQQTQKGGKQACSSVPGLRLLPGVLVAYIALAYTMLSLKFRGFSKTYALHGPVCQSAAPIPPPLLESECRSFVAAENLFLIQKAPNDCLVRSLALFRYLCWRRVRATHIIGIRRVPFAAHAWVEVEGEGVLAPAPRGFLPLTVLRAVGSGE